METSGNMRGFTEAEEHSKTLQRIRIFVMKMSQHIMQGGL